MPEAVRRAGELEAEHPYLRAVAERDLLDELHRREFLCVYYAMVSEVDANIGRLLSVLDETGQRENTLVVFTSDHGEYAGDHYLSGKTHFYDAGMRVPLIIRDPSKEADSGRGVIHREGFVEAIDIAPTIFAYLGEEIPRDFQGRNVLDSVRSGQQAGLRTEIHYENDFRNRIPKAERGPSQEGCLMWVLRDACYKYVQFADDSFPPLLFDMVRDPGEFVDLAAERPQLVARYGQRMLRWRMVNEDQDSERMKAARDAQSD
jgi:arylsulfatase A-like enzyme